MSEDLELIKRRLRRFVEHEAQNSPLYGEIARHAVDDDEVAGLLTAAPAAEAVPTLLLAVAHRLLAADPVHQLSRYYPTLGGFDGVDAQTWPLFRSFLLERADAARELIATRYTQTNEVQRSAVVYPAVALAAKEARGPIGLLEVGTSAGLLLGMDRYRYDYLYRGERISVGPAKAPVGLHCAVSDASDGTAFRKPPKLAVGARIGLDRRPVDLADEEQLAWLEACIWADQLDRVKLLRTAAAAQLKNPPELVTGDAVDDLAATAARLPADLPLVVLTSHAVIYFEKPRRAEFVAALGELARSRPLWWVANGPYEGGIDLVLPDREDLKYADTGRTTLAVTRWTDGTSETRALALAESHGRRMTWLG